MDLESLKTQGEGMRVAFILTANKIKTELTKGIGEFKELSVLKT